MERNKEVGGKTEMILKIIIVFLIFYFVYQIYRFLEELK